MKNKKTNKAKYLESYDAIMKAVEFNMDTFLNSPTPGDGPDLHLIEDCLTGVRGEDQAMIAGVGLALVATLLRKNHDYGSSVFNAPVFAPDVSEDAAIRVRMSDKVSRLKCLLSTGGAEVESESVEDTVRDLAGYAILYLCKHQTKTNNEPTIHDNNSL